MARHSYGWHKQLPDFRDRPSKLMAPGPLGVGIPKTVDLSPQFPAPYDQGQLGSCTANATAGALQYMRRVEKATPDFTPSRLFEYYDSRVLEGTTAQDAGANLRDCMKALVNYGYCDEGLWPYNIAQFAVQPPASVYAAAAPTAKVIVYSAVPQDVAALTAHLAAGVTVVFGITVYTSFESATVAKTGVVPMPKKSEKALGGHALLLVGYALAAQRFKVRNSWGTTWGMGGYCTMPFAYLENPGLASDFWMVTKD